MDTHDFSIPIGPNGRAFRFSVPTDLTHDDAAFIADSLPALLKRAAWDGEPCDDSRLTFVQPRREILYGPGPMLIVNKGLKPLDLDELKPIEDERAGDSSNNGHVHAADISDEHVDEKPVSDAPSTALPEAKAGHKLPRGRWSIKYDKCVTCGRTDRRHTANGLCTICSAKQYNRQKQEKKRAGEPSPAPTTPKATKATFVCSRCKRSDRPHCAKGFCGSCHTIVSKAQREGREVPALRPDLRHGGREDAATNGKPSTNGTPKPPVTLPEGGCKDAPFIAAPPAKPSFMGTPVKKAPWPLKSVSADETLKIASRMSIHLRASMKLDEIAIREGLDLEKVRKVYDAFRNQIDASLLEESFVDALHRKLSARFEFA